MTVTNPLLVELSQRELIAQTTAEEELAEHLNTGSRAVYCGFDPTADSLHIGSLVPLLAMRRIQQAGHKPILLVGGATGLIGDPSFKAAERKLNSSDVVEGWVEKLKAQVSRFVDFDNGDNAALVVNNLDWTADLSALDFLRDIGKHFSVNQMIQKESVKQRLDRDGEGISFTEFTYMILQSYDFAELNKRYDCTVQIGGSDQWGNITGGTDLTRRMNQQQAYGITLPLVTKADGTKFGKTESGTIWLDANKTSPYAFYQFWLNTADADVYKFLRYFTFLSVDEIATIEKDDDERQGRPEAQRILAEQMTELVHGEQGLQAAQRITRSVFGGDLGELVENDYEQLSQDGLPSAELNADDLAKPLTSLLADYGLGQGKQIKDALGRNAVLINGNAIGMGQNMAAAELFSVANAKFDRFFMIQLGKKKHFLVEI